MKNCKFSHASNILVSRGWTESIICTDVTENLDTRKFGRKEIWTLGNLEAWKLGRSTSRFPSGSKDAPRKFGH